MSQSINTPEINIELFNSYDHVIFLYKGNAFEFVKTKENQDDEIYGPGYLRNTVGHVANVDKISNRGLHWFNFHPITKKMSQGVIPFKEIKLNQ